MRELQHDSDVLADRLNTIQSEHAEHAHSTSLELSAMKAETNSTQGKVNYLELEVTRLSAELATVVPRTQSAIVERDAAVNSLDLCNNLPPGLPSGRGR